MGYDRLPFLIRQAHKSGLFAATAVHKALADIPLHLRYQEQLHSQWTVWIREETYIRTAWMLYLFDTLNMVDTGATGCISLEDIGSHMLPAPKHVWEAPSLGEWCLAMVDYQPISLDAAISRYFIRSQRKRETPCARIGSSDSRKNRSGFRRLVEIMALLRSIIRLGRQGFDHASSRWQYGRDDSIERTDEERPLMAYRDALDRVSLSPPPFAPSGY
jgi:hypothetical protein